MTIIKSLSLHLFLLLVFYAVISDPAYAAGTGMPWEGPLQQIVDSITGPVAAAFGAVAIVVFGAGAAFFSDGGTMLRKGFMVGAGLSIAFTATRFFLPLFGFAGGASF